MVHHVLICLTEVRILQWLWETRLFAWAVGGSERWPCCSCALYWISCLSFGAQRHLPVQGE